MRLERVSYVVDGDTVVGHLHLPDGPGPHRAVVVGGPMTSVKEQVTGVYAQALARRGFAATLFTVSRKSARLSAGYRPSAALRVRASRSREMCMLVFCEMCGAAAKKSSGAGWPPALGPAQLCPWARPLGTTSRPTTCALAQRLQ